MRTAALTCLVFVALCARASADVFVPSDPAEQPRAGECVASAGDVFVAARSGAGAWTTRLREGTAPSRILPGAGGCPRVRVAADGTAVVAAGSGHVFVREPGGTFGAPIRVGGPPSVAVAPGGWVAVAWLAYDERRGDTTLEVMTRAPGGAVSRAVLGRTFADLYAPLSVGIDAGGNAAIVWTAGDAPEPRARIARSVAGGPWSPVADLPGETAVGSVDLAVSPAGHTLVTWSTREGVHAMLDAEPARRIAAAARPSGAQGAISDSGAALVAFTAGRGHVLIVERPAGADWLPEREISGSLEATSEPAAASLVAPDGRAIVAWVSDSVVPHGALVAVAGRPGGPWGAPTSLSSPVRPFATWSFRTTGEPGLDWTESADTFGRGLVRRSAALVADAPEDRTAPVVTTRLRSRLPATSTGRLNLRVPVRCSEACTASVDLGGDVEIRDLAAGERATFTVGDFGDAMLARPGPRRLELQLRVADRAGNLTRRSQTVRVRVRRVPLTRFKVAPNHDFATCTKGGNRRLGRLVNSIIDGLADKSLGSAREIRSAWQRGHAAIERAYPKECLGDTAVREQIYEVLDTPLTLAGYSEFDLDA